ncbi:SH3 domain-containing protein [Aeromicrobium sp. CF4.19]|uniref:SH3 domain-containing protein n=1 Tax=Aeromicrobium sp. CF4.19 TaxID=3373082 RepID=UPI003EE6DFD5
MASSRHKHAVPKRAGLSRPSGSATPGGARAARRKAPATASPWRGRAVKVALPALGVLTLVGTSAAVISQDAEIAPASASIAEVAPSDDIIAQALEDQDATIEVNRSAERPELPAESEESVDVTGTRVALKDGVAVRADAKRDAPVLATLDKGDKIDVTGETAEGWTEVVHKDLSRWVKSASVAKKLPEPPEPALGTEPCPTGSESGLQPNTVKVLRAVCAKFPEVSEYGGVAGRGEHATGHALDIMVRGAAGDSIAAFLQENQDELGIEYLIWEQQIWRPATSASWRPMSNRGGDTANHMDHVHVTTVGSGASGY